MKNSFKKCLVGLGVFVLLFTLSCSSRESETANTNPEATNSYNNAQSTLQSIGLAISIPSISDFADTTDTNQAALTSVFDGNDSNASTFDTTKLADLESAIEDLQTSLAAYTAAPKSALAMSPKLVSTSYKNSDLTYIHFLLGYYYTLDAVLKLRIFVEQGVVTIQDNRYKLDDTKLNNLADSGKQAVLDAFFLLNGVRYQIDNTAGNGKVYADKTLPAGPTKCASYHLDRAIFYAGSTFPQLKEALMALKTNSFEAFFSEIAAKATALGVEPATD